MQANKFALMLLIVGGAAQLFGAELTLTERAGTVLNYSVLDAAYSRQVQRIIMISSNPPLLHFLDPNTYQDEAIPLPFAPLNFSVGPDGRFATVNYGFLISYVDLVARGVIKTFEPEVSVAFTVLGMSDIYLFPATYQQRIRSIRINSGFESIGRSLYYAGPVKRHPAGSLYGTKRGFTPESVDRYNIVNGTPEVGWGSGYYAICGNIWFSEDASKLYTACGNVLRTSDSQEQDLTLFGQLQGDYRTYPSAPFPTTITALAHSAAAHKIAAFSGTPSEQDLPTSGTSWVPDTDLLFFDDGSYRLTDRRRLPGFIVGGNLYPGHGQFVFFSDDGMEVFVLIKPDAAAGFLRTAIARLPTAPPPGSRRLTLGDLGSTVLTTTLTSSTPIVGHLEIKADESSNAPLGVGIFGYRQNNVTVTETGVAAVEPIRAGRFYVESGGNVRTGLALSNPWDQSVAITFYATTAVGDSPGSTVELPPHGQVAAFLDEPPFSLGNTAFGYGSLTFNAELPVGAVALRGFTNERSEFLLTTIPVTNLEAGSNEPVIFPHFAVGRGWSTTIILVNSSDDVQSGTLDCTTDGFAQVLVDGQTCGFVTYEIPSRSVQRFELLAPNITALLVGSIRVTPNANNTTPGGVGIFSYKPAANTVSIAGVPAMRIGMAFRLPFTTSFSFAFRNAGGFGTGIAIVNPDPLAAVVTIETTFPNGITPMNRQQITLAPNSHTSFFLNEGPYLTSYPSSGVHNGLVRIFTSPGSRIAVMGLRGLYNERSDFLLTVLPAANETAPKKPLLLIPHMISGGGYRTQLMLANGSAGNVAAGTLRVFQPSGQPLELELK